MSAADNLGNLFVALLAGIPLLIFLLFACCACLEASIVAARRQYKPHLPTRVRFADQQETTEDENERRHRNPLLFGLTRSSNRSGPGRLEGSGLMAHSSYIQRFPNYRYSTLSTPVAQSTPPPALKNRTEHGSGSIKSPVSPLAEVRKLLEKDHRSTPPTHTPILEHSPYPHTPTPGRAVRQDTSTSSDTQQTQFSQKSSPTHLSNVLNYFEGSRRSSTPTPTSTPGYHMRPKSPFDCGPHMDPQHRRYSTPSSPTMYAYQPRPQGPSNYSSMSYLPEVRTYLHFMEDDFSNRQRSHSFSGRSTRRSLRRSGRHRVPRTPSPFALERTMVEDNASEISSPSSFGTFLTPPGSTDQGSFKSPESVTPDWLLNSDVRPTHFMDGEEAALIYKQQLSRSSSIRTSIV